MVKELIDLQLNSKATCAIIPTNEYGKLSPSVLMRANVDDVFLFAGKRPVFADKLDERSKLAKICYFIIGGIDALPEESQNRYIGMVKDRKINGYSLPNNVIIVFTVSDKSSLKLISPELYRFSVVAF